ncbi:hypothetical protein [Streptomyces sp. NPDC005141]
MLTSGVLILLGRLVTAFMPTGTSSYKCRETGGRAMLAGLRDAGHLIPLDALPDRTAEHAQAGDFAEVLI